MAVFDRSDVNKLNVRFGLRQMKRRAKLTDAQLDLVNKALEDNTLIASLADYVESEAEVMASQAKEAVVGGPIADAFALLIQDFINNPEKWIKIIMMLFAL